jgi:hypothetical protein
MPKAACDYDERRRLAGANAGQDAAMLRSRRARARSNAASIACLRVRASASRSRCAFASVMRAWRCAGRAPAA